MAITLPTTKAPPIQSIMDAVTLIYGPPGVGKTTVANDFGGGDVLFLSTDRGTRHMQGGAFAIPIHRWLDMLEAVTALEKDPKTRQKYTGFAIDHVDDVALMCEHYVCKQLGIEHPGDAEWGKGWSKLRSEFMRFTQRLLRLGKGIIFVAHEDTKEIDEAVIKFKRVQPAMPKASWKVIVPLSDFVMYCGFDKKVVIDPQTKKQRRIETRSATFRPSRNLYAKDRTGILPPKMELNGKLIRETFIRGKAHGKGQTNQQGSR